MRNAKIIIDLYSEGPDGESFEAISVEFLSDDSDTLEVFHTVEQAMRRAQQFVGIPVPEWTPMVDDTVWASTLKGRIAQFGWGEHEGEALVMLGPGLRFEWFKLDALTERLLFDPEDHQS